MQVLGVTSGGAVLKQDRVGVTLHSRCQRDRGCSSWRQYPRKGSNVQQFQGGSRRLGTAFLQPVHSLQRSVGRTTHGAFVVSLTIPESPAGDRDGAWERGRG